jgi:hypothetical protein
MMSGNARIGMAAQRVFCLILAAALALVLAAGAAIADPPDVPPSDNSNTPAPLNSSSDYPADLNRQLVAFKERVTLWLQRYQELEARSQSLKARIDAHNATVDSYPNRVAPPAIADAVNAEAAALQSEKQGLRSQIDALMAEHGTLETERLQLLQRISVGEGITKPIRPLDPNARPGGRPTRLDPDDDAETTRGKQRENESAIDFARAGYDVYQNPPPKPNGKQPDLLIGGKYFDVAAPSTGNARNIATNSIQSKVDSGQADRIILNLKDSPVSLDAMRAQLYNWPIPGLKEVIAIDKQGNLVRLYP